MGGFSSFAFQIRMNLGFAAFDDASMNALQRAILRGAPAWASMSRVSRVGRWTVSERFDASQPGALFEAIEAHRPGGRRAPATLGLERWGPAEAEVVLTGSDRGASIKLTFLGGWRSGEPASLESLLVETTKPQIDGQSAGSWIEALFRSLCFEMQPSLASASSLGERMAGDRYGARADIHWLTYLDARTRAATDLRLWNVDGVDVEALGDGLLIKMDPSPGPRRLKAYWAKVRAVEPLVGRLRFPAPARPREPVPSRRRHDSPVQLVPRPRQRIDSHGRSQVEGARYERVRVAQLSDRTPGRVLEGFELVRCELDNVSIGSAQAGEAPVYVRNSTLTRCKGRVVRFGLVAFEDCVVDGYAGGFWPTASILLRHVTLRGNIDALDLRWPGPTWLLQRADLAAVHEAYYLDVDWAVDISQARFARCDIEGVPGHLIRRDPATQVLVTLARARASNWLDMVEDHFWRVTLRELVDEARPSQVLVACPREKRFEQEVRIIGRLREAGVVEPD